MANEVEFSVVASLLDSGATLAAAGHAAALMAGAGCLFARPLAARIAFAVAILFWFAQCYAAVRTRIDASLFLLLAEDPASRALQMDQALLALGLPKGPPERSLHDRCAGALRLWRLQIAAFAMECAAVAVGMIVALRYP
jgi:hypothetical protein